MIKLVDSKLFCYYDWISLILIEFSNVININNCNFMIKFVDSKLFFVTLILIEC